MTVAAAALTPLREDLDLLPGPLSGGQPTWSLYDPARHRFVRLGWLEFEILCRWRLGEPAAILESIARETTLRPQPEDLKRFADFARDSGLLQSRLPQDSARLAAAVAAGRHSAIAWLIHNYLFFRIRLLDPDRFLAATLPLVRWLFSRAGLLAIGSLAALALFLVSREWDRYLHSLAEQTTLEGLLQMGLALSLSKVFHELGHGYAAKRMGCRVPSMGVAFLVLWPVLWTDTTDAWRLADRRSRLVIDAAGMAAEILIAALASIAWAILPDGPARSAAFVLSSSTWLMTLLVNLNPLMRFDGYYILSDLLDFPNLQERAFARARWLMREGLFRPGLPPPEPLSPGLAASVTAWAFATWIYRFFLFLGIALMVYHFAFKALGLVLMGIEIWYFIARPIVTEMRAWARLPTVRRPGRRTLATLALLACGVAILVVPWRGRVDAPALLRADRQLVLQAAEPGELVDIAPEGRPAVAGDVLFRLRALDVEHEIASAQARLDAVQGEQTAGLYNPERRRLQQTALARTAEAAAARARAESRAALLQIAAPFAGTLRDVPTDLRPGVQVRRLERLGVLVAEGDPVVEAYVAEADIERLRIGAPATFIAPDGPALRLVVREIASASTRALDVAELASIHDGPVAVRRTANQGLVPEQAVYRVVLAVQDPPGPIQSRLPGAVTIEAPPRSFASIVWRRAVAVLLREAAP